MAHEILSVKLCQLDERMERLHSRIHISETASRNRLQQEIDANIGHSEPQFDRVVAIGPVIVM